mmetsp:Transcript_47395/g.125079  ORF Transcript_47395/g.125079 Transcript_47395/m.125079 type:complete len:232 (+) Transcript_47395:92-787(+)
MSAEAQFNRDGYVHRTTLYDDLQEAKAKHGAQLNFTAYRQGTDREYLGINGKNYYAKPWGNDSSNVQAVLNGPAYWKRVYYRQNVAQRFQDEDRKEAEGKAKAAEFAARAEAVNNGGSSGGMRKSSSAPALRKLPAEPAKDTYADIKESMKPFVEKQGKPRIRALETGEKLNFHNTLGNKYHMKVGGRNLSWGVSTTTHRSTKNEINWVLSNYFRTDSAAVLAGAGSEGLR